MTTTGVSQLVVVGASSGGIDALRRLLEPLRADLPAPIVIAQHLAPDRRSHLAEILAARTALEVRYVDGEEALRNGVVYVVPAAHDVRISDHHVAVEERRQAGGSRPSVDRLLTTAAEAFGERLIAVVLTGEGSDGAEGARAVKAAGGTVVIEDPRTAAHPSMPMSLAPTTVDIVAPVEDLARIIQELATGTFEPVEADPSLDDFLQVIRGRTGIDFSAYKPATIQRRLRRRMAAVGAPDLTAYAAHVSSDGEELQRLTSTFLIKVTDFFRDPELFEFLRTDVVPALVEHARARNQDIRVWSAGCATGEETYSLAILLAEALGPELARFGVRIFGTDLDNDAIEFARRGIYTRSAASSLPAELVDRYFQPAGDDLEVRKSIRAITVFGQHDLAQRAPFPRIDLALSRNVLIYFTPELQKRALQLFAFSLRQDGFLVLGKAETVSVLADHFEPVEGRLKVYRRFGQRVVIPPARGDWLRGMSEPITRPARAGRAPWAGNGPRQRGRPEGTSGTAETSESLLLRAPIGAVLVDDRYDILLLNTAARQLLQIHGAAIGEDFIHTTTLLDPTATRQSIDAARQDQQTVQEVTLAETAPSGPITLRLTFQPQRTGAGDTGPVAAIWVEDVSRATDALAAAQTQGSTDEAEIDRLRKRLEALSAANARLAAANVELTTANAELRSANEELLVGSEEVQAASEEVETLNEELQATNEELETLNEELQATVEELDTTNDDLEARTRELEVAVLVSGDGQGQDARLQALTRHLLDATDGIVVLDPSGRPVGSGELVSALVEGGVLRSGRGRQLTGKQGVIATLLTGKPVDIAVIHHRGEERRRLRVHGEPLFAPDDSGRIVGGALLFKLAPTGAEEPVDSAGSL